MVGLRQARRAGEERMAIGLRPATRDDAGDLARLVDMAGEGLPSHLWAGMAEPGEDVWEVGRRRAARDEGAFSWRNATMATIEGGVAGCLVGYPIAAAAPEADLPPLFRPIQALENAAVGTWYVNVLATYPARRQQGVASALMAEAERRGGAGGTSLIVADRNAVARRFYEHRGYVERDRRRMVKEGWRCDSEDWVLMVRPPAA
jgi:ribosomal protein S18 acetylase RimI-like enzyme